MEEKLTHLSRENERTRGNLTEELILELDLEIGILLAVESKPIASLENIVSRIKSVECREGIRLEGLSGSSMRGLHRSCEL